MQNSAPVSAHQAGSSSLKAILGIKRKYLCVNCFGDRSKIAVQYLSSPAQPVLSSFFFFSAVLLLSRGPTAWLPSLPPSPSKSIRHLVLAASLRRLPSQITAPSSLSWKRLSFDLDTSVDRRCGKIATLSSAFFFRLSLSLQCSDLACQPCTTAAFFQPISKRSSRVGKAITLCYALAVDTLPTDRLNHRTATQFTYLGNVSKLHSHHPLHLHPIPITHLCC